MASQRTLLKKSRANCCQKTRLSEKSGFHKPDSVKVVVKPKPRRRFLRFSQLKREIQRNTKFSQNTVGVVMKMGLEGIRELFPSRFFSEDFSQTYT